ncbi:MAG: tetratricopeptide repeat protein [Pyrinomonadaceae bacterium]|nr:tetratricopeptide repeat protein [Pyrinomonadaceae bacterium]
MLFNRISRAWLATSVIVLALVASQGLARAQSASPTPNAGNSSSSGTAKRPKRDSQGIGRYVNVATNRLVFAGASGPRGKVSKEAQAVFDRAKDEYEAGKLAEAVESFRQATRMSPDWAEAQYWLGGALAENGSLKDSLKPLKLAMQLKPATDENDLYILAAYSLGNSYFGLGRYKEAVKAYEKAKARDAGLPKVRYNLGLAFVQMGKLSEAVREFKEAVRLKPEYAEARYNLGLAYLDLKEKELALEQQRELKSLDAGLAELLGGFIEGGTK